MHKGNQFASKSQRFFIRAAAIFIPLFCMLLLLSQTVFAQNTFVITDGSRVTVHTTYTTDPAAVLGEAGFQLGEADTYTTQQGNGISEITVLRGSDSDTLSAIQVVETYTDTIPHGTTYCGDPTLTPGSQRVLIKGEDGQMLCTASVVYENGREISRTVLTQTVTVRPVDEVVAQGPQIQTLSYQEAGDLPIIEDGLITLPTGEVLTYTDTMTVLATAYTWTGNPTATGTLARVGEIAVDPRVIPLGSRLFIVSDDGQYIYGIATAEDTGGLIKGKRIDLYYDTESECIQFGARNCTVYFLG